MEQHWTDFLQPDERALLEQGVDWTNPTHVLLLRLATERYAGDSPYDPLMVAALTLAERGALVRVLAEMEKDRPAPHECVWGPPSFEDNRLFPWCYCSVCGRSMRFRGKL